MLGARALTLCATLLEMEDADSSSLEVVTDPEAARLLSDPETARLLFPFIGRERTVSEVARELGFRVDAMYYRVKRLERSTLLRVSRTVERKGRAIRTYVASSRSYFVPLAAVPDATVEDLLEQADVEPRRRAAAGFAAALREAGSTMRFGVHVRLDDAGDPSISLGPEDRDWSPEALLDPSAPALLASWAWLQLDFAAAKALQRELYGVISRYAGLQGSQGYLMGLTFTPARRP